jgi:two-component system response regulator CpxR
MALPSLLIVDDDLELARMLGEFLAHEGFRTSHATCGEQALALAAERAFDLLILDVMMPGLDGLAVLTALRRDASVPVIMLTARGEDGDRILGLELGADDYLAKPFNPHELVARIRAILRRLDRPRAVRQSFRIGPLALDPAAFSVAVAGRMVRLTTAEFLVLETLARGPGRMQSRAALTETALGRRLEAYDRSIDTHVANLRRKLGLGAGAGIEIRSVRGAGYMLVTVAEQAG